MLFKNRSEAGELLSNALVTFSQKPVCVLGLARGGVVAAAHIAHKLGIPFDILVIKKLSSPHNPELAIGAVAPDNVSVIHWKDAQRAGSDEVSIVYATKGLSDSVKRDMIHLRKGKKPIDLTDKTAILVDDGAATEAIMEAAVLWARKKRARKVIIALPVASNRMIARLKPEVDAVVVQAPVDHYESAGSYYKQFDQVTDQMMVQLLRGGKV